MKYLPAVLALFLLVLCVDLSYQVPRYKNCSPEQIANLPASTKDSCGTLTCQSDSSITMIGCGTYQCAPGKQKGYREPDNSKPTPECCGGPICED